MFLGGGRPQTLAALCLRGARPDDRARTTSGTTYFGVEYASTQHNDAHRAIHQPCACIYGTTTPLHFWQALQAANVADGSLARFLIMGERGRLPDSNEVFGAD